MEFSIISLNNKNKTYLRESLINFDGELNKEKGILKFKELLKELEILKKFHCENLNMIRLFENLEIFFYNSESIVDYGWGCAWRCFQTFLKLMKNYLNDEKTRIGKIKDKNIQFEAMFMEYGDRKKLEQIYLKKINFFDQKSLYNKIQEVPSYLKNKNFAPFENLYGWAEPFIFDLIAFDLEFYSGKLFLLNGYPENASSPNEVFEKIICFNEFLDLVFQNFDCKNPLPIIIDDSVLCFCIVGIRKIIEKNSQILEYEILVADPHVSLFADGKSAVYTVLLDSYGKMLRENHIFEKTLYGTRIDFADKRYMIYCASFI